MDQPKKSLKRDRDADSPGEMLPSAKKAKSNETLRPQSNPTGGVYKDAPKERKFYKVTGNQYESEHTVGYSPLADGMPRKKSTLARSVENNAPAYLEEKPLHRAHIGTGTTNVVADSGFNSESYRAAQQRLVAQGDMSSAVQLNQLDYAYQPGFTSKGYDANSIANRSFDNMVDKMKPFEFVIDKTTQTTDSLSVDAQQRAEMYLGRRAALTGKFPTREEENAARIRYGLDPFPELEEEAIEPGVTSATPTLSSSSAVTTDPELPSLKQTQGPESTTPSLKPSSSTDAAAEAERESSLMEKLGKLPSPPTTDPAASVAETDAVAGADSIASDAIELVLL